MQEVRHRRAFFAARAPSLTGNSRDIRVIYCALTSQQDCCSINDGASNTQEKSAMLKQTVVALSVAVVLVAALGSASSAQQSQQDWWRLYQQSQPGKHCVGGDGDESAAYPSWMYCHRR
jgi:hypothetical protein